MRSTALRGAAGGSGRLRTTPNRRLWALHADITAAGREVTASRSGRAGSGGYEGKLFSQRAVGHRLRRKAGAEEQPRGPLPARARSSARCHTTATRGSAAAQPAAPRPATPTHISELGQAALPHLAQALVRRAALQEELRQAHRLPAEQRAHGGPGRRRLGSARPARSRHGGSSRPGRHSAAPRPPAAASGGRGGQPAPGERPAVSPAPSPALPRPRPAPTACSRAADVMSCFSSLFKNMNPCTFARCEIKIFLYFFFFFPKKIKIFEIFTKWFFRHQGF